MYRWSPNGPLLSLTAASTAPTSVQLVSNSNVQSNDVKIDNTSSTIDAVLGWGQSDAAAKLNCVPASGITNCVYIQHGTIQVISIPNGAYISGISVSSTAVIKVQTGIGG